MASKNTDKPENSDKLSPNRSKNASKRPLTSPEDLRIPKKPDNKTNPMAEEFPGSLSERLKAIRVASSQEAHSYIPTATTQTQGNRFRTASEHSFTGTWNKGTTDVINIEMLSINGEDFKGSFKRPEALYIWTNILNQDQTMVHGISFKTLPGRNFQIVYRLKTQISVDQTFQRDDFSYNRGEKKPDGSYDIVCGRILGLKPKPNQPPRPQSSRDSRTRVNLYGCEFDLSKEQILNWMAKFGEVLSEPMDILDRDCPDIATGDMSIIMRLSKQIPSFLPMYGKKIRVAYRGMTTVCSNCFDVGHMRIGCENQRASYLDYVTMLINTERFEKELFGNWATRAEKFQAYKERQKLWKQKRNEQNFEPIDEETYVDTQDDDKSTSSYRSTETILDENIDPKENENDSDPASAKVVDKITSFEMRTGKKNE